LLTLKKGEEKLLDCAGLGSVRCSFFKLASFCILKTLSPGYESLGVTNSLKNCPESF